MSSAQAAKLAFHAIRLGVDRVPDKYWDKLPGHGEPKHKEESHRSHHGHGHSERDPHHRDHRGRRDGHARDDTDGHSSRHRDRARSEGYEPQRERRSSKNPRVNPAVTWGPEDTEFYSDAEQRRQVRRLQKRDTWHQQQTPQSRDSPATSSHDGSGGGYFPPGASEAAPHFHHSHLRNGLPSYLFSPDHTASAPVSAHPSPGTSRIPSTVGSVASTPPPQPGQAYHPPPPPPMPQTPHSPVTPGSVAGLPAHSRAAEKYTPAGVTPGQAMYGEQQ